MSLRAIRSSVILTGVIVGACGGGPDAPSPIPNPHPPGPAVFETPVRVVSAFSQDVGVPQVLVTVGDGSEQQTDAAGVSTIRVGSASTASVRLRHSAFLERETYVRVPDDRGVNLSLIPTTHDPDAFEEFSPRLTGLRRWTRNPRLLVLTHAVDFAGATDGFREYPVIDRLISPAQRECLSAGIAASLGEMSGGHLTWESIEVATVEPGTRFRTDGTPEGTIVVLPSVSLGSPGRGIGYTDANPFVISRGAVWLSADLLNFCVTALLYRHELGHALGYQHVTRTLSIMGLGLAPPTDFDRRSIAILFQRPPGNRSPDRDPMGISVNLTTHSARVNAEPLH